MDAMTRSTLALTLAAALGAGAQASGAADAGKPAAWEKPPAFPAESQLFHDRLSNPHNHFLIDGEHAFVSGDEFHRLHAEAPYFLWPAHPWMRILPGRGWLRDTTAYAFSGLVGNEVGDPLLGELSEPGARGNRTPATLGGFTWSPTGEWGVHAGLDQNDHFSYRNFGARRALARVDRAEDLSWIGGNLPPRSQLQLGAALRRHGGLMAGQFNRGWWWTTSPVSGQSYAWEGFNADFLYRMGDDFDILLTDQSWETPVTGTFHSARWRRMEVNMGFSGASPGGWRWRLETGWVRRDLYADSAFPTFEENRYLSRFRYRRAWAPEGTLPLRLETQGFLAYQEKMFAAQQATDLRFNFGKHSLGPGVKAYWRNPLGSYRDPVEFLAADSGLPAVFEPAKHARGATGTGEYRYRRDSFLASLGGFYALEWGAPIFRGSVVDTVDDVLLRSGVLGGSDHHLATYGGTLEAGGAAGSPAWWRVRGGLRGRQGRDEGSVEYRPSPWWVGGGLGLALPSGLRLEGNVHYMGPKEVRGWGPVFRVPARPEGNAGAVQSFFEDRLEVTASLLHAFGDDMREHPNGNPMRFRILVGARGAF
jgi:hypothetical protein